MTGPRVHTPGPFVTKDVRRKTRGVFLDEGDGLVFRGCSFRPDW